MDPSTLAILGVILGVGALGGGGYTSGQKRLFGAQADIAELMNQLMRQRAALTGPNVGPGGELTGPMVDALVEALRGVHQARSTPRLRLATSGFNPFGTANPIQTFGPSSPPAFKAPSFRMKK